MFNSIEYITLLYSTIVKVHLKFFLETLYKPKYLL